MSVAEHWEMLVVGIWSGRRSPLQGCIVIHARLGPESIPLINYISDVPQ